MNSHGQTSIELTVGPNRNRLCEFAGCNRGAPKWSFEMAFLIWFARVAVGLLTLVTLVPLLKTGAWYVRLWDFPRVQLLMLALLPTAAIGLSAWRDGKLGREHVILAGLLLCIALWQLSHILPYTRFWRHEIAEATGSGLLTLMVANVEKDNGQHEAVLETLRKHDPDLLLLIEINEAWSDALASLAPAYEHRTEVIRDEGLGIALWSKLPLHAAEVRHLVSERRASIFTEVALPAGGSARFVGLHPTPPGLDDASKGGRRDSRVRDAELVLVAREVSERPNTRWIVAGDFNDVAWSHTTRLFKRLSGLKDPRVGRQLLNTYHADYPLLRYPIDQVFLSPGSTIQKLERVRLPGSDHFAIVASFDPRASGTSSDAPPADHTEAEKIIEQGVKDAEQRNIESDEAPKSDADSDATTGGSAGRNEPRPDAVPGR